MPQLRFISLKTISSHDRRDCGGEFDVPGRTLPEWHKAWYYNEPGSVGIVNQDFELLRLLSLEQRIEELVAEHTNQTERDLSPSAALAELLGSLQEVVRDTTDIASDPRAAYVSEEWRRLTALSETGRRTRRAFLVSWRGDVLLVLQPNLIDHRLTGIAMHQRN